ncbi:Hsp20/alpha crystallin family protein [Roseovarius sp.]|uniref:Hsp20/alpha crystallin family protein n=1 Tax=Roseovarius sp. TaxID=1486281 RepID=UPI003561D3B5
MNDERSPADNAPAMQGQLAESDRGAPVLRPIADIVETGNGISVQIEMPGVSPEDVDISVDDRMLTVRGRSRAHAPEGYDLVQAEYERSDYERSFALGRDIDEGSIAAEMREGVLTLLLPMTETTPPRKIAVKDG